MRRNTIGHILLAVISLCVLCCNRKKDVIVSVPEAPGVIGSTDIPVDDFFWMLRPWREGTLVTIDGHARFSELSFAGNNKIKITPLIQYPRTALDRQLIVFPGTDLIIGKSGRMFHVADIATGTAKSFAPFFTWRYDEEIPLLIDPNDGLVAFPYRFKENVTEGFFIIYDHKRDRLSGEYGRPDVFPLRALDGRNLICITYSSDGMHNDIYIYNLITREKTRNELTETMTRVNIRGIVLRPGVNIDFERRYLFVSIWPPDGGIINKKIKITWEEGFEDVKVTPLDYLIPEGKWLSDFFLSSDGKWATCFMGGFRGLYRELLDKRVFFHLDGRYPNGISMPIFADGYETFHWDWGSFVEHPEYGWCFAEEKQRTGERGKDQRYLRLYKMSDVENEINRQLPGKAREELKQ